MYTRREFGQLSLAALALPRALAAAPAAVDSKVAGVRLGVQTYSFRELPRPEGGDAVDVIIKAMTECGLGECELWSPQIEPRFRLRSPALPGPHPTRPRPRRLAPTCGTGGSRPRSSTSLGSRRSSTPRACSIFAFNYSFNPELHGRGDRPRVRDGAGPGRGRSSPPRPPSGGPPRRSLRGEAQDGRGHARPLQGRRPQRVRHSGELRRRHGHVEVLQGQPGHRALHRRQLRRRRLHARAPRRHHEHPPEGPQEEPGRQHALGQRARRRSARCSSSSRRASGRSPRTSNTSTRVRGRRSRK